MPETDEEINIKQFLTLTNVCLVLIILIILVMVLYVSSIDIEKKTDSYSRLARFEDFINDVYTSGGGKISGNRVVISVYPKMTFQELMWTYNLNIRRPGAKDWIINKLVYVCDGTGSLMEDRNYTEDDVGKLRV